MTKSILDYLLPYKDKTAKETQHLLHEVNCWIFDPLFKVFEEHTPKVVFYILLGYSKESPLLILMADYKKEKEGICKYLDMPEELIEPLTTLSDDTVRTCVLEFIEDYAPQNWKTLQFLKIQLADLNRMVVLKQIFATQEVTEGEDDKKTTKIVPIFDPKAHRDTMRLIEQLGKSIAVLESQIKNSTSYLHIAQIELKDARSRIKKRNLGVENSLFIIKHDKE